MSTFVAACYFFVVSTVSSNPRWKYYIWVNDMLGAMSCDKQRQN
jgi:hypothetical protein